MLKRFLGQNIFITKYIATSTSFSITTHADIDLHYLVDSNQLQLLLILQPPQSYQTQQLSSEQSFHPGSWQVYLLIFCNNLLYIPSTTDLRNTIMPNRYVYMYWIKRKTRGQVLYLVYILYFGMVYVICVTGMQFCVGYVYWKACDLRKTQHSRCIHKICNFQKNWNSLCALLIRLCKITQINHEPKSDNDVSYIVSDVGIDNILYSACQYQLLSSSVPQHYQSYHTRQLSSVQTLHPKWVRYYVRPQIHTQHQHTLFCRFTSAPASTSSTTASVPHSPEPKIRAVSPFCVMTDNQSIHLIPTR